MGGFSVNLDDLLGRYLRFGDCAGPDIEYGAVRDGASGSVYLLASAFDGVL